MNIVIVEDEVPASSKLEQLILRYDENINIIKIL
ncbi:MAG: DNA-binding response regulator, partial [Chloroflexia bacterium]|nr:DNA-binding response regulator [Chloroflexia bacterium]